MNGRAVTAPIQIRTAGTSADWKYMESNTDSLLKTGQSISTVLVSGGDYKWNYEIQVGIPQYFAGVGTGIWTTKAGAGTAKNRASGFSLNGFGYQSGGQASAAVISSTIQYADNLNTWTTKASIPTARQGSAPFSVLGFSYICSGFTTVITSEVNQYNDSTNVWATKAGDGAGARQECSGFSLNEYGYCCGGAGGVVITSVYTAATNVWTAKSNFGTGRHASAGMSINGFGYICGGFVGPSSSEVNQYNDAVNTWSTKATAEAKYSIGTFNIKNLGYSSGGFTTAHTSTVHQYIDQANIWISKIGLQTARSYVSSNALNGMGYICSGTTGSDSSEVNQYSINDQVPVLNVSLLVDDI
jgi:hypothetical protein